MKGAKTLLLILVLLAGGAALAQEGSDASAGDSDHSDAVAAPAQRSDGQDGFGQALTPVRAKTTPKSQDQSKDEGAGDVSAVPSVDRSAQPVTPEGGEPDAPAIDHRPGGRRPDTDRPPYNVLPPGHGRRQHRGRHDEWRHRHYGHYGSWRFLWHLGPIIITPPHPPIVRRGSYRPKVYVRHTGSDEVGVEFTSEVRDQLMRQGLKVVYSPGDATLELYILSMDIDPDDSGYNSSVSVSYIWQPGNRFITAQMLDVGGGEIDDLAEMVVEYADDLTDNYR